MFLPTKIHRNGPPATNRAFTIEYQILCRYLDIERSCHRSWPIPASSSIEITLIFRLHIIIIQHDITSHKVPPNAHLYASSEFSSKRALYTYVEVSFSTFLAKMALAGHFILACLICFSASGCLFCGEEALDWKDADFLLSMPRLCHCPQPEYDMI